MNSFRLMSLLALTLLLVGCYSLDNVSVSITNNSSEDIFYRYGTGSNKWVDGKKIVSVMGTLKPQESKELNDQLYQKGIGYSDFWVFSFELSVGDKAFHVFEHFIGDDSTINIEITDTLLGELDSLVSGAPFSVGRYGLRRDDAFNANPANFYGFLTVVNGEVRDDFYLLLDGVVYLADISERKLVKVE